jgi:hypothetical protein
MYSVHQKQEPQDKDFPSSEWSGLKNIPTFTRPPITQDSHHNEVIIYMSLLSYANLHFTFQYIVSINKCKWDLIILRHCQLYIKVNLLRSMAKHVHWTGGIMKCAVLYSSSDLVWTADSDCALSEMGTKWLFEQYDHSCWRYNVWPLIYLCVSSVHNTFLFKYFCLIILIIKYHRNNKQMFP